MFTLVVQNGYGKAVMLFTKERITSPRHHKEILDLFGWKAADIVDDLNAYHIYVSERGVVKSAKLSGNVVKRFRRLMKALADTPFGGVIYVGANVEGSKIKLVKKEHVK